MFDLRSDTVTRPCEAMRRAMAAAAVGDDVFSEDPTVLALQRRVAQVVGKEAALFMPSGTMANQVALMCHTRPGDEVIVGRGSHCAFYESGAGAAINGVQFEQVGEGVFTAEQLQAAIKPRAFYCPNTSLVVVENTHNRAGGRVFVSSAARAIVRCAHDHGLKAHMDGARLWNAAAALKESEQEICAPFDTVSVCFSKGLGAPVGSALCGDSDTMRRAIRFRKMLGGGMRQVGIIAAGALYALEHNRARVNQDHVAAQALAKAVNEIEGVTAVRPDTNIVNVTLVTAAAPVVALAAKRGVHFLATGAHTVRLVTHLDVSDNNFDECIRVTCLALRQAVTGEG